MKYARKYEVYNLIVLRNFKHYKNTYSKNVIKDEKQIPNKSGYWIVLSRKCRALLGSVKLFSTFSEQPLV